MAMNFKMVAKTLFGMEELLANELRQLGASSIEIGIRNVSFEGDMGFMYKANLCCRTAIKILKPINAFNIFTEEDLYKKIYEMPWEQYMQVDGSLAVNATVFSDVFTHSQYIALKTKDRSEEHTSELQSRPHLVCRLLLEKKKKIQYHVVQHM